MMEQRTPEWFASRAGKITASRIADMMARTKTGWGASRENYMAELICQRLTGTCPESFESAAMRWGTETEPLARTAYEFLREPVVEVGFVDHPTIPLAGASPDGTVGDEGLIEIKCPNTATHIDYLLGGGIPQKYMLQMQFQMACTERKWCDYLSFDPRLDGALQSKIERVERNEKLIGEIESAAVEFLAEVEIKLKKLQEV